MAQSTAVYLCCTFPVVAYGGRYPLSLPCGARTFLTRGLSAHLARLPGQVTPIIILYFFLVVKQIAKNGSIVYNIMLQARNIKGLINVTVTEYFNQLKDKRVVVIGLGISNRPLVRMLLERGIAIRDSITPIIPIYTYDEMRTLRKAKELFDAGVYVNPVLPPATPPGESLLRTSYMANHTETILDEALDIIERIVKND